MSDVAERQTERHETREPAPSESWRTTGERIDALISAGAAGGPAAGGPAARERGEELVRLVTDFYGAGLERLLDLVHEHGGLGDTVLAALAGDELVSGVLLVHGLHPYSVETRVENALESVRPYLGSHGGDVELIGVTEDGAVRLRLLGSCDGCPSSSATLALAVRGAVEAAAPEITTIDVADAAGTPDPPGPLLPVDTLFSRLRTDAAGAGAADADAGDDAGAGSGSGPGSGSGGTGATWQSVPALLALEPGGVERLSAAGFPVVACRIGADLFAFRDRCARCERPMNGATLARRLGGGAQDGVLRCSACRAHYDVRRAGACLDTDADGAHLDPLPVLADGASVSVAVPCTPAVAT
ncbi:NifU family protein [Streptomyces sp. NPDC096310]|uniref:NifU family protein n=1 Tax=Streptomyces sp. NPDC096310 TaxID=3366082 RepID=UPI00382140E3